MLSGSKLEPTMKHLASDSDRDAFGEQAFLRLRLGMEISVYIHCRMEKLENKKFIVHVKIGLWTSPCG